MKDIRHVDLIPGIHKGFSMEICEELSQTLVDQGKIWLIEQQGESHGPCKVTGFCVL